MSGHDYAVELEEAREILNSLRKAYKEHAAGRGMTKRLEAAAGVSPRRSGRIITRF